MVAVSVEPENECFFIAPIGEEGSDIRKRSDLILRYIVKPAAAQLSLTAIRADELAAPGQITLRVIVHLMKARAVVADLTGRNPNVYYELAIRHATRLPVALIIAKSDPPLPFDLQQMNTIRFDHTDLESADYCREQIILHLQAALRGEVDSPITASVELQSLAATRNIERKMSTFFDDIADSLQKNAESSQLIMETLTRMNLPRNPENERRVGAALGEALERVVERTRDSSFIEVDIGAFTRSEVPPLRISYEPSLAVSRFLDYIWFEIRDHDYVPAYTYGVTWVLEDATTGQSLFEMGRTWAEKSLGEDFDSRPLAHVGIKPGMRLKATRVGRGSFVPRRT